MEARNIVVISTRDQKKTVISSEAETLLELKNDLTKNNIDYTDMTFMEGISKTTLNNDASQLPKDVVFKGEPTNNLVIILTYTKSKISSGVYTRRDLCEIIKSNNLQESIKITFGKNYTNVSTEDLNNFVLNFNKTQNDIKTLQYEKVESTKNENLVITDDSDIDGSDIDDNITIKNFLIHSLYNLQNELATLLEVVKSTNIIEGKPQTKELNLEGTPFNDDDLKDLCNI